MNVERELEVETEILGENLPQCHFVHRKSHIPPRWEVATNHLCLIS
jgi:hypothetical protein